MGIVQFIARALMIMIIAAAVILAAERFQEAADAYQAQEQAKDQSATFSNSK